MLCFMTMDSLFLLNPPTLCLPLFVSSLPSLTSCTGWLLLLFLQRHCTGWLLLLFLQRYDSLLYNFFVMHWAIL